MINRILRQSSAKNKRKVAQPKAITADAVSFDWIKFRASFWDGNAGKFTQPA